MNKIICIGNATWDQTLTVNSSQLQAKKTYANSFSVSGGGVAASAAAAIADCGEQAVFIGRLGRDMIGEQITSELISHGVNVESCLRYEHAQSSIATVILSDDPAPQIYVYNDPCMPIDTSSLFNIDLSDVTAIVADITWPEGVKVLFERAKQLDIPTFLRVSFFKASILELLEIADYSVFNHPSLLAMTGDINLKRGLIKAQKRIGGNQVVTLGDRGCAWFKDASYGDLKAHPVNVIDTTGAGDIFIGILAMFIGKGEAFETAIKKANIIAGLSCEFKGARQLAKSSQVTNINNIQAT